MTKNPRFAYRADIDGLRCIAVLAVVVYHAFPGLLPGGYTGVDIFFVISGFLISSILFEEVAQDSFSIKAFYIRRIRRLFPALLLVLAVSLLIAWTILLPHELRSLAKHAIGGAAFLANIFYWSEISYFNPASELKPLLHLWSLGIEEQFYFIWPLLIAAFLKRGNLLVFVLVALSCLSFITNIALVEESPQSAFFLPHTRFWELFAGGLLAYLFHRRNSYSLFAADKAVLSECCAVAGLALLVFAVGFIDKSKAFPGWWALVPVTGSCLLIGAGQHTWLARNFLSLRFMVWVGLISYPLYLWHWPLLSFARITYGEAPPVVVRAVLVAVAILLAWLSFKFVEQPFQKRSKAAPKQWLPIARVLAVNSGIIGLALLIGMSIIPPRLQAVDVYSQAFRDWQYPTDKGASFTGEQPGTVMFFGDSYIRQYYGRIDELHKDKKLQTKSVRFHTEAGCAPVPEIARKTVPQCLSFATQGFLLAQSEQVDTLVIGGAWLSMLHRGDYYFAHDARKQVIDFEVPEMLNTVMATLEASLATVQASGTQIELILTPPVAPEASPAHYTGRLSFTPRMETSSISVAKHLSSSGRVNDPLRAMAARLNITVIDPANWFCNEQECLFTDAEGYPYYKDATHIRSSYARCCIKAFDHLVAARDTAVGERKHNTSEKTSALLD